MKQVFQSLKTGTPTVEDVPVPTCRPGYLLIQTSRTLISAGTERMLVEFGKAGWLQKARQQPHQVKKVLTKVKTDGLMPTLDSVRDKLDQPLALGYCNVGTVIEVGRGVTGFNVGDRVISNGHHAEVVSVPVNLCAKVPESVEDEAAAFTVLAAIALQGIRLANPTLGERVVVMGLGLVGLLAAQLLMANGCQVLGMDHNADRTKLARNLGIDSADLGPNVDPVQIAERFSNGEGVDAVLIAASTQSSEPVHHAALMSRKRGRIVLVGVTGLELLREDFYEKELTFQVSSSYGPGRYDPDYEEKGQDYPFGFVRWTEQRNFEAVLSQMERGTIDITPLITHRFHIDEADAAYELISGAGPSLGILLEFDDKEIVKDHQTTGHEERISEGLNLEGQGEDPDSASPVLWHPQKSICPTVSFIGAGSYATSSLIPAFKKKGVRLKTVVSQTGSTCSRTAKKFGFAEASTDVDRIFADPEVDAVSITTRHDSHADYVVRALTAGKSVFVEKPLCLNLDELIKIKEVMEQLQADRGIATPKLMVGFNRRFSPHVKMMKDLVRDISAPKTVVITVNAGHIPSTHWTQDPSVGGGRIIGEACHFIDLLRYLVGRPVCTYEKFSMSAKSGDTVTLSFSFDDGSIGSIHYLSNGSDLYQKERVELFTEGKILQLNNFRKLEGFGWTRFKKMNLRRQDKGRSECVAEFIDCLSDPGRLPIALDELWEVSKLAIDLASHD